MNLQIHNIMINTPYSRELAESELLKFNNDHLKVINNYIQNKSTINNSLNKTELDNFNCSNINREIFTQCRKLMDDSMIGYNKRKLEKETTSDNKIKNKEEKITITI